MTEARSIDLAVIPGDGIGPEIITEAQRILTRACELENITVTPHPLQARRRALAGNR